MKSEVVKHHEAKRGFVLLPRHWVVERTFAWPHGSADWWRYHWLAVAMLMLKLMFAKSA